MQIALGSHACNHMPGRLRIPPNVACAHSLACPLMHLPPHTCSGPGPAGAGWLAVPRHAGVPHRHVRTAAGGGAVPGGWQGLGVLCICARVCLCVYVFWGGGWWLVAEGGLGRRAGPAEEDSRQAGQLAVCMQPGCAVGLCGKFYATCHQRLDLYPHPLGPHLCPQAFTALGAVPAASWLKAAELIALRTQRNSEGGRGASR